ncbi:glycoside hydrolase family 81 protein [Medicago truncatula]|uniref:glucan endo-1,3-beta-D-glucosidase n=1 Tax=Medicago truncatula TaxID=3880 RepID=G7ZZW5_MEDTR|nr:glycoside hydrolase family 81 protein [Medicago truncatula]
MLSLRYFLYRIAVLAKIDSIWGRKYKYFVLCKLHSWAGGLTEFTDGRNQESASEAMNAYYSAALITMVYEDAELAALKGGNINSNNNYTCLRCFDLYKLHSWAGGLTEFADGRNQESTSDAVNAYYSAALIGMVTMVYEDAEFAAVASTLASLEVLAAKMWWHVK